MKEDHQLVADALANGPEAFGPIVERYQHAVFAIALSRLGAFDDAEDIAQQVFIEAFQRLDRLRDPVRLGAWLRSITVHRCIDLLRRRTQCLTLEDAEHMASCDVPADDHLCRKELRQQVMAAIAKLPRKQRETVTLFYINGYSIRDIAAMQEAPVGSIKRRLHDARGKLKGEILEMVEDTLKTEAPKEDFARRVFELLCRKGRSQEPALSEVPGIVAQLKDIGTKGVDGLVQALQAQDWQTRATAVWMIKEAGIAPEPVVDMLKQTLTDVNQKLRSGAPAALLSLQVSEERKRKEFVPLIIPLLTDPTRGVRGGAASALRDWAADVPLEVAARALAQETDGRVRRHLGPLVLAILEAREKSGIVTEPFRCITRQ